MKNNDQSHLGSETIISPSDIVRVLKTSKKAIAITAFSCALLMACYTLLKTPHYTVTATFQEKASENTPLGNMWGFIRTSPTADSITIMQSRSLIIPLIQKLGLQTSISEVRSTPPFMKNIRENIAILSSTKNSLAIPDICPTIKCINTSYPREFPSHIDVTFISDDAFVITSPEGNEVTRGVIGNPLLFDDISFTLISTSPNSFSSKKYTLFFAPELSTADKIIKDLEITQETAGLITLQYHNRDRHLAASLLNNLMWEYQHYREEMAHKKNEAQLSYLKSRQKDSIAQLEDILLENATLLSGSFQDYATNTTSDFFVKKDDETFLYSSEELRLISGQQSQRIKKINATEEEITALLDILDKNMPFEAEFPNLIQHSKIIPLWIERLKQKQDSISLQEKSQFEHDKELLKNHLHRIQALYIARKNALQDHLERYQTVPLDHHTIDPDTVKNLYLNYVEMLDALQIDIQKLSFVKRQLRDSSFEISSLSTVLNDSVSMRMIDTTRMLLQKIHDTNNHSEKEINRLKEELEKQRELLDLHIEQTLLLLKGQGEWIRQKIQQLQETLYDLMQHKISIEWLSDKKFELFTEIHATMVKEVSHFVEEKIINTNLEKIELTPLDFAVPPIAPAPTHLLMMTFLGMFVGAFISSTTILLSHVFNGFTASPDSLALLNQHVSGILTSKKTPSLIYAMKRHDIETIRHIVAYSLLSAKNSSGNILSIIGNNGPDFSKQLATIFTKKGHRTLVIECDLQGSGKGLFQYLDDPTSPLPTITTTINYDLIAAGSEVAYSAELLTSKRFTSLLNDVRTSYDWIITFSNLSPNSAEALSFADNASVVSITVCDEKLNDISPYFIKDKNAAKPTTFIFFRPTKNNEPSAI